MSTETVWKKSHFSSIPPRAEFQHRKRILIETEKAPINCCRYYYIRKTLLCNSVLYTPNRIRWWLKVKNKNGIVKSFYYNNLKMSVQISKMK